MGETIGSAEASDMAEAIRRAVGEDGIEGTLAFMRQQRAIQQVGAVGISHEGEIPVPPRDVVVPDIPYRNLPA